MVNTVSYRFLIKWTGLKQTRLIYARLKAADDNGVDATLDQLQEYKLLASKEAGVK